MSKQGHKNQHDLLPYAVIQAATKGDAEAISTVLQHYEGYIARLSMRPIRDPYPANSRTNHQMIRMQLPGAISTGPAGTMTGSSVGSASSSPSVRGLPFSSIMRLRIPPSPLRV